MTDTDPRDFLIGVPLQSALAEFHHFRAKGKYAHCTLYQNKQSGGTVLATRDIGEPSEGELNALSLVHWCSLSSYDLPTVTHLLWDDTALAALTDYVLHELPPEEPRLLQLHAIAALSSAFTSAVNKIADLEDHAAVKGGRLPLTGPLKKVLNYMAIQFSQGQYEFLNIAYNMAAGEYELHTPADIERLHNTGKFGDRRLVLCCSVHELKKIITTDQLKLELPDVEQHLAPTREDRQLDSPINSDGVSLTDATKAGRSDNDGPITRPESDSLEPSAHRGENT